MALELINVKPENFERLSIITGRSIEELQRQWELDTVENRFSIVAIDEFRCDKKNLNRCFYQSRWSKDRGHRWVCALHNQESKYHVDESSNMPCLGVDPYP